MIVTIMTMTKRARVTSDAAAKNETERVPRAAEYEAASRESVKNCSIMSLDSGTRSVAAAFPSL